jgi:hypothetical protein
MVGGRVSTTATIWVSAIVIGAALCAVQSESLRAPIINRTALRPAVDDRAAMGMKVPLPATDVLRNELRGGPLILVFAGACSSCSLHNFDPRSLQYVPHDRVIVSYEVPAANLPRELTSVEMGVQIVADPQGELRRALPERGFPISYRLNSSNRIDRIQRVGQSPYDFIIENPTK